jgi:S-adenosylmethionine synthetase
MRAPPRYAARGGNRVTELLIRAQDSSLPGEQPLEVVERKGLGHPDSICDAVAERVCVRLCEVYRDRFGVILHHNVDKVLLVGGAARARFGGGEIIEPIELYLAGRATSEYRGVRIPVSEIAVEAAGEWIRAHLGRVDPERHVRIVPRLRGGSADLTALFARGDSIRPLANDTSCGAGFAPLTDLERVVLAAERALNSPMAKQRHPALGEDVKIMGVRRGRRIELTVGCAIVASYVPDIAEYARATETAHALVLEAARATTPLEVSVAVNVGDDLDRGDMFLTVTGTSAEAGDDGEVGRGNRANGLITPYRPMTLEAAAGKNPVTHVGKLYNVLASRLASAVTRLHGVRDASCVLVSRIGAPIDEPQVIDVQIALESADLLSSLRTDIDGVVREQLSSLATMREDILAGRETVY